MCCSVYNQHLVSFLTSVRFLFSPVWLHGLKSPTSGTDNGFSGAPQKYEGGPRIGGFCPQSSDLFESARNSGNTGQKPPIRGPPSYQRSCKGSLCFDARSSLLTFALLFFHFVPECESRFGQGLLPPPGGGRR